MYRIKVLTIVAVAMLSLAIGQAGAETVSVPNGDFELIYKSGQTVITGALSPEGDAWTEGVGPACPIGGPGQYEFSDATVGTVADIAGWLGYDRDGWIAFGGTYGRDETTGNLQGSVRNYDNVTPGGSNCYSANGGDWGNPAGGLIVSEVSLGNVLSGFTYTLSMYAQAFDGGATPVVLDLLVDGEVLSPDTEISPDLTENWQEFTRIYNTLPEGDIMVVIGIGRDAEGGQTRFDDVTLGKVIYYVNANATSGDNNGTSWEDAFILLQDALDAAVFGDKIWVAAGTYYPTSDYGLGIGDRGKHFRMKDRVGIYGGFANTGNPDWADRDPGNYETILSGDIGTVSDNSDNCYHVFYHPDGTGLDGTAVLDGFTITAGNADGDGCPACHDHGGGMFNDSSSPTVINCIFEGNSCDYGGGGIFNTNSSMTVSNCTFRVNSSNYGGGGMANDQGSKPTLTNCTFSGNLAGGHGGGMANWSSSEPELINCTFAGNESDAYGGGMNNSGSCNSKIINCSFSGNSAGTNGGGMNNIDSDPIVTNCILWGNTSASGGNEIHNDVNSIPVIGYCDIAGCGGSGWDWDSSLGLDGGGGNIDADPLFVDADGADNLVGTEDDNLRLLPCSPCIDAGDNSVVTVDTDLDGNARIVNGIVGMGAYETSNNEPFICSSISQVQFRVLKDSSYPLDETFGVRNGGGGTLNWTITASGSCDWLTISPLEGSSTGETDDVTLNVDLSGLAAGDYNCDLTISADGALNSPEIVPVVLEVLEPGSSSLLIPISLVYDAQCCGYAYAWIFDADDSDTDQDSSVNGKAECQAYANASFTVEVPGPGDFGGNQRSIIETEVEGHYEGSEAWLVSNIQGYGYGSSWSELGESTDWLGGGDGSGYTSMVGTIDIGVSDQLPNGTPDVITLMASAGLTGDHPGNWYDWDWWLKIWEDDPDTTLMELDPGNIVAELSVVAGQRLNFEFYVEAEQDRWPEVEEGLDSTIQIDLGVFVVPNVADVNGDYRVDLADFGIVSAGWMEVECDVDNNFCSGADIDQMGDVGLDDLLILAGNWLEGVCFPVPAFGPAPTDGAADVNTRVELSWSAGECAVSHNIYFGTSSPGEFQCNQTDTTFDPGALELETMYYWRVDEVQADSSVIEGNVWRFTTGDLVGQWELDESSGTVASDSVGGHDGTLMGDPTWWPSGGRIGGALEFDGVGDYVEVAGYKGISGSNPRTVSAWVKVESNGSTFSIVRWGTMESSGGLWSNVINADGKLRAAVIGGSVVGGTTINDNTWHHVAIVLPDKEDVKVEDILLYVDGGQEDTTISLGSQTIDTAVGMDVLISLDGSVGLLDDVRIYNYALSEGEIGALAGVL